MTPTLDLAITDLHRALDTGPVARPEARQRQLLQALARTCAALDAESTRTDHGWLTPRAQRLRRECAQLLEALQATTIHVTEDDPGLPEEVRRLVADLEHHRQRVNDLVYDDVEGEIGGSG